MKTFVETERLILREVLPEDVQGFFELDSDPEVHKYLGNNPVKDIQKCEEVIELIRKQYIDNGIGRWSVIHKESNQFIGWSGLKYETGFLKDFNYYDIGYRLKREFWGQGFGTESALASLEYGFNELNLEEIYGAAHVENTASNKILKKIGLKFLETIKWEEEPCNWYRIKKSEW